MAASSSEERPVKEAKRENTQEKPNWFELIPIATKILNKLGAFEIFTTACFVCTLWWKICNDPLMWRTIDLTNHPRDAHSKLLKFCYHAIERSRGHLEDISIEDIATSNVLKCIADSGSHLRRMRLLKCWEVSYKQLRETIKKLPLLEEFEISYRVLSADTLKLMGKYCPHLKVLKFNKVEDKDLECDDEAFAIAKTMPGLRHLQLLGNRITNKGLLAILDGCPNLESFDLRACSKLNLSASLRERCRKQIRNLRFPEDLSGVSNYVHGVDPYEYYCGCDIDIAIEMAYLKRLCDEYSAFQDSSLTEYYGQ